MSTPEASVRRTGAPTFSRHWAARQEVLRTSLMWDSHLLLASRLIHCHTDTQSKLNKMMIYLFTCHVLTRGEQARQRLPELLEAGNLVHDPLPAWVSVLRLACDPSFHATLEIKKKPPRSVPENCKHHLLILSKVLFGNYVVLMMHFIYLNTASGS